MSPLQSNPLGIHSTCFIASDPTPLMKLLASKKKSAVSQDTLPLDSWIRKGADTRSDSTIAQYHENYEPHIIVKFVITLGIKSLDRISKDSRSPWNVLKMTDNYHHSFERATEIAKNYVDTAAQEYANTRRQTIWYKSFVHGINDDYHGPIARTTKKAKYQVSTLAHESAGGVLNWVSSQSMAHEYRRRIDDLRAMADEEGFTVAEASIRDFWVFYSILSPSQKAELVVNPNENLRAIWDDDRGDHVGIQFRGAGVFQYVIFKGPAESPKRKYDAGRGDIEVVRQRIRDFNLENLLGIYGV